MTAARQPCGRGGVGGSSGDRGRRRGSGDRGPLPRPDAGAPRSRRASGNGQDCWRRPSSPLHGSTARPAARSTGPGSGAPTASHAAGPAAARKPGPDGCSFPSALTRAPSCGSRPAFCGTGPVAWPALRVVMSGANSRPDRFMGRAPCSGEHAGVRVYCRRQISSNACIGQVPTHERERVNSRDQEHGRPLIDRPWRCKS